MDQPKAEKCFVCSKDNYLITYFPQNSDKLKIWKQKLNLNCPDKVLKNKKLCIRHFEKKYHSILLNPKLKRSRFIFPIRDTINDNELGIDKKNQMNNEPETSEKGKGQNYELLIAEKDKQIIDLKNKIVELEKNNKELRKECNTIKHAKNIINSKVENLTPVSRILLNILLDKRHLYSEEEKSFCQNLYAKYPGAYTYLNNLLGSILPTRRSLVRWQQFKELDLGIIPHVMAYLKSIKNDLNERDCDITLIMDEIDIKKGIQYCSSRDKIIGYVQLIKHSPVMAKKVLAFMIRGLNKVVGNVIVASFSTEKGVKGDELAVLIRFLIRELKSIGFRVVFVNQDQSGVNRRAYSLLGATIEEPYFYVDEMKVWTVYDVPHLIKSVSFISNSIICSLFYPLNIKLLCFDTIKRSKARHIFLFY